MPSKKKRKLKQYTDKKLYAELTITREINKKL